MNLTVRNHEFNHEGTFNIVDGSVMSFKSDNGIVYPESRLSDLQIDEMHKWAAQRPWDNVQVAYSEWVVIEHTIEGYVSYDDDLGWTIDDVTIDGQDPSDWGDVWYECAVEALTDKYEAVCC